MENSLAEGFQPLDSVVRVQIVRLQWPTCGSELGMVPVALLTRIASSCTCSQLTPHNAPNHAGSVLELQDERNLPIFPAAPGLVGKRDVLTL